MAKKISIRTGDIVKVIAGKNKGDTGKVLEILREQNRIRVEGIAKIKRHIAPQKNPRHPEGGIIEDEGSLHISNVMLMSEALERPVRTGSASTADGKKMRVARGKGLKAEEV
ncbi:MAG: 50S ribosomal protein L24 [Deltaproteobacteria bacterium]|nr:50S ribosomal protein L24 [Deltaproteobacteria bacterium]